ncbi:MAG: AAA family ATPase [Myxococcota bacterium]
MQIQPLPVGLAEFTDLMQGGFVYVDKTQQIYQLLRVAKRPYFLARPRRFGKSLLISTLEALFQGRRELFEGLWMEQHSPWDWSQQHPVIRLDMSLIANATPQELKQGLCHAVRRAAAYNRIELGPGDMPNLLLGRLIEQLARDNQVVVLIDAYDKPLIDHLGGRTSAQHERELDIAYANRDLLKSFFAVLKGLGGYLRLVFVTGVSKFARTSIFSDLNNLTDLTLDRSCADLAGYTQQELETNFVPHLQHLAAERQQSVQQLLDDIRQWYNGFRFSSADLRVYNPFSTLLLLQQKEFRAHWFATGTPSFLTKLVKHSEELQPNTFSGVAVSQSAFESYELDQLHEHLLPLMVQTGYLTITHYNSDRGIYRVDFPNQEVRQGFLESLMEAYSYLPKGRAMTDLDRLTEALQHNDLPSFFVALRAILAGVPYHLHISLERYYQTVFYLIYQLLGYSVHTEVCTNVGRIDAVIDLDTHTYVFEFKLQQGQPTPQQQLLEGCEPSAQLKSSVYQDEQAATLTQAHTKLAQAALQQIKDRQYGVKYAGKGKPVTLVGAVFTVNTLQGQPVRQVTAWVSEAL